MLKLDLRDHRLFGNDAAEDEQEEIFLAHVLERPELAHFINPTVRVGIVRAYKGEGKSALLRLAGYKVSRDPDAALVLSSTGSALNPQNSGHDSAKWVLSWKLVIINRVAGEIGARIGLAFTDDAMSLVEEAEKQGFRERSFLGSIGARLKARLSVGPIEVSASEAREDKVLHERLIEKWSSERGAVWLFLDDIDQNFQNTPEQRSKVAAFFIAIRELTNQIPQLRIRTVVRPNVWTTIKLESEALSHVEQYVVDLTWSEYQIRDLIAKRIQGYLALTGQELKDGFPSLEREREIIKKVFQDPMAWGRSARPPHVVIHTLSKHRPRWVVELVKSAAQLAADEGRQIISKDHLMAVLEDFGKRRIEDTIAEFSSQCPEVEEMLSAFRGAPEHLTTAELLKTIDSKILSHLSPRIAGTIGKPSNKDVAAFLFQVGFFYGRQDSADGSYKHIAYSDRPHLFRSRASQDDGLTWEVHPVFRQALDMRTASGEEIRRRKVRR